ncbi:hydrogenase expression/formation protein HypE [Lutibacter sp. TH_r2]|uniref:hydrogenase expression/formation protein HypE n=1 Tax=Lutibacter sp. TH_r2 TaxID=3082083 RepID=UPI002955134A|nr:hydrogenase expression/formation protein HypE [Lutibacter sp. TH_r2]MDV7186220.1 hydrogenase expression/formation protein HypE [Lutibacter sp. TH_r2]
MSIENLGFETIHLGHGSGGELTRNLLDKIIFKTFSNPYLDQKHDGSIVQIDGKMAISTDSFVITPIFFKGGNIGELAVHGTVNDVAMCGAIPKYLSLAFIIEEGMKVSEFVKVVESVKKAADESGVLIITGDTKVVERGKGDKIFINTTGFGAMHPKANISVQNIKEGDVILVNGFIAQHGMAIMSEREGLEFESTIESDSTNLNYLVNDLLDEFGEKIKLFRDPTRGGLGTVLHELANDFSIGVALKEIDVPVEKQVAAACEMLGLDPMYVANEGVFLTVVDASIKDEVLALMQNHSKGKNAAIIGKITSEHPNKVVMQSLIGGKRIVSPLVGEQLPRIC